MKQDFGAPKSRDRTLDFRPPAEVEELVGIEGTRFVNEGDI
ncbi:MULTISPECIES: hypothetical protein [Cyanophyceae]|nr:MULTISPECIES: hypothetical protein [unclassified Trichocoleus]